MRILVTGGAGFIGSHVSTLLLDAGHEVTILDSLEKGNREAVPPGARFLEGDLASDALLASAFGEGRFEAAMHFAAYIEAGESMREPARFFRNNTANALRLAEAAATHGVGRFIFSSTAAVYGDPEYTPIDEGHPTRPTNAYGMAKLLTDQALDWIARLQGLTCVSLRYFNAAGAGLGLGEDHRPETHLIPLILEAAAGRREALTLFGDDYPTPDGTCVRDYIHVLDLAKAHLLALEADLSGTRHIYNLGNGTGFTNRQVVAAAEAVTGLPVPVKVGPRRAGDPAVLVASSEKIRRELGWRPDHPGLEAIIRSVWEWKQAHPEGYRG
ncbi:MAG TPA: UDP-glucose 4-epimerase GalE [Holophaga sp.]|nr:UDP-glucose 4-epimerase GalE [Holophaga sp.]